VLFLAGVALSANYASNDLRSAKETHKKAELAASRVDEVVTAKSGELKRIDDLETRAQKVSDTIDAKVQPISEQVTKMSADVLAATTKVNTFEQLLKESGTLSKDDVRIIVDEKATTLTRETDSKINELRSELRDLSRRIGGGDGLLQVRRGIAKVRTEEVSALTTIMANCQRELGRRTPRSFQDAQVKIRSIEASLRELEQNGVR
jgi:hypothetical protein